jgi:hypothetical protein
MIDKDFDLLSSLNLGATENPQPTLISKPPDVLRWMKLNQIGHLPASREVVNDRECCQ